MNTKKFIWIGMFVGSSVGGFIPTLWGADVLSFSSLIFSAIGAFLGIWFGFKLSQIDDMIRQQRGFSYLFRVCCANPIRWCFVRGAEYRHRPISREGTPRQAGGDSAQVLSHYIAGTRLQSTSYLWFPPL